MIQTQNQDQELCAICQDNIEERFTYLSCMHQFHNKCIAKWLNKYNNTCPICRHEPQPITTTNNNIDKCYYLIFFLTIILIINLLLLYVILYTMLYYTPCLTKLEKEYYQQKFEFFKAYIDHFITGIQYMTHKCLKIR